MAEIKIAATSGGGSISLKGPSTTTGNANVAFVLPVADGSAGQYLKTDGSKNFGWVTQPTSFSKLTLTGAANSSKAAGDFWYDTDKKFHFYTAGLVGTWSNGANHPDSGYGKAGAGTLSAAITTGEVISIPASDLNLKTPFVHETVGSAPEFPTPKTPAS